MAARILLALAAAAMLAAAILHASAFPRAEHAVAASNLAPFFGGSLKAFWLNDSLVTAILAVLGFYFVLRPRAATGGTIMLLALIPASIAVLLFVFLGLFFAAPVMLVIAGLIFAAGLFWPNRMEIAP